MEQKLHASEDGRNFDKTGMFHSIFVGALVPKIATGKIKHTLLDVQVALVADDGTSLVVGQWIPLKRMQSSLGLAHQ